MEIPMRTKALMLLLTAMALIILPLRGEDPLTNQDVVKMVSAGLGEGLVITKLKGAAAVNFALEVDDLVALRKAGVSEKIVQAMLERQSGSTWPPPSQAAGPSNISENPWASMQEDMGFEFVKVALRSNEGTIPIRILRGDVSTAGFMGIGATYMNYPGIHAQVRTHDRRPAILVKSSAPLSGGNYFLAKLDVDQDDGIRSLKISSAKAGLKAVFGKTRGAIAPDTDFTLPFDSVEESPGIWRVTAKADLTPGEYGWYVDLGSSTQALQAAGLFGFGVD
jgi:hypothetical protein